MKNIIEYVFIAELSSLRLFRSHHQFLFLSKFDKEYCTFKKSNIKYDSKWFYDFYLNDEEAYCYFWNNEALGNEKWKLRLSLKTWGGENAVRINIESFNKTIDDKNVEMFASYLVGGLTIQRGMYTTLIMTIFFLIPGATFSITLYHFFLLKKQDKEHSTLSWVSYFITGNITHIVN